MFRVPVTEWPRTRDDGECGYTNARAKFRRVNRSKLKRAAERTANLDSSSVSRRGPFVSRTVSNEYRVAVTAPAGSGEEGVRNRLECHMAHARLIRRVTGHQRIVGISLRSSMLWRNIKLCARGASMKSKRIGSYFIRRKHKVEALKVHRKKKPREKERWRSDVPCENSLKKKIPPE